MSEPTYDSVRLDALRFAPPSSFKSEDLVYVRAVVRARCHRLEDKIRDLNDDLQVAVGYLLALTEEARDRPAEDLPF